MITKLYVLGVLGCSIWLFLENSVDAVIDDDVMYENVPKI